MSTLTGLAAVVGLLLLSFMLVFGMLLLWRAASRLGKPDARGARRVNQ
jgi:hypothetical protein